MCSKALPFLRELLECGLAPGLEYLGLWWREREEFPRALALQRALRAALLTCGPQQAATGITEVAFDLVIGPGQARHVIAVQQAAPLAPADRVEVTAKRL